MLFFLLVFNEQANSCIVSMLKTLGSPHKQFREGKEILHPSMRGGRKGLKTKQAPASCVNVEHQVVSQGLCKVDGYIALLFPGLVRGISGVVSGKSIRQAWS